MWTKTAVKVDLTAMRGYPDVLDVDIRGIDACTSEESS
jgi:hypothetical protein